MNQEIAIPKMVDKILAASKKRDPSIIQTDRAYLYIRPGRRWCNIKPVGLTEGEVEKLAKDLAAMGYMTHGYSGHLEVLAPTDGQIEIIGSPADESQKALVESLVANYKVGALEITETGILVKPLVQPKICWPMDVDSAVEEIWGLLRPIFSDHEDTGLHETIGKTLLWRFGLQLVSPIEYSRNYLTLEWGVERPVSEGTPEWHVVEKVLQEARHLPNIRSIAGNGQEWVVRFKK